MSCWEQLRWRRIKDQDGDHDGLQRTYRARDRRRRQNLGAAFHAAGARIALGDVNTSALGSAAERLGASDRAFTHAVDVRDASSVEKFVAASESALGAVTIAIANARIYPNCPVLEMTQEEWDRVIETTMRGVFLTCQAVARRMVAAKTPEKIITISSGAHNSGRKGAAHCASKAGMVMFTKVLAMELGPYHNQRQLHRAGNHHRRPRRLAGVRPGTDAARPQHPVGPRSFRVIEPMIASCRATARQPTSCTQLCSSHRARRTPSPAKRFRWTAAAGPAGPTCRTAVRRSDRLDLALQ
jgi:NAD(P)-dependent dehydrogenase (short-subunit alcohol dehydrogenase family)